MIKISLGSVRHSKLFINDKQKPTDSVTIWIANISCFLIPFIFSHLGDYLQRTQPVLFLLYIFDKNKVLKYKKSKRFSMDLLILWTGFLFLLTMAVMVHAFICFISILYMYVEKYNLILLFSRTVCFQSLLLNNIFNDENEEKALPIDEFITKDCIYWFHSNR